jgi:hypothetical protein
MRKLIITRAGLFLLTCCALPDLISGSFETQDTIVLEGKWRKLLAACHVRNVATLSVLVNGFHYYYLLFCSTSLAPKLEDNPDPPNSASGEKKFPWLVNGNLYLPLYFVFQILYYSTGLTTLSFMGVI